MSLKSFFITIILATGLAWGSWILVIINIDPMVGGPGTMWLFYGTLFLALFGTGTILGLLFRRVIIKNDEAILRHLKQSLRQAGLFGVAILGLLYLAALNLLVWWVGILLIIVLVLIEFFFYSKRTVESGYV